MSPKTIDNGIDEVDLVYGEAAERPCSGMPPGPQSEPEAPFKHIGGSTPRIDGAKVVTGAAPYTRTSS